MIPYSNICRILTSLPSQRYFQPKQATLGIIMKTKNYKLISWIDFKFVGITDDSSRIQRLSNITNPNLNPFCWKPVLFCIQFTAKMMVTLGIRYWRGEKSKFPEKQEHDTKIKDNVTMLLFFRGVPNEHAKIFQPL